MSEVDSDKKTKTQVEKEKDFASFVFKYLRENDLKRAMSGIDRTSLSHGFNIMLGSLKARNRHQRYGYTKLEPESSLPKATQVRCKKSEKI